MPRVRPDRQAAAGTLDRRRDAAGEAKNSRPSAFRRTTSCGSATIRASRCFCWRGIGKRIMRLSSNVRRCSIACSDRTMDQARTPVLLTDDVDDDIQFGEVEEAAPNRALRPDRESAFCGRGVWRAGGARPADLCRSGCAGRHGGARPVGYVGRAGRRAARRAFEDEEGRPFVVVTDSLRAQHYESTKGSFKFTHDTWSAITREREQFPAELQMVGWYHTHPDWGVFLSGMDMFICDNFFNKTLRLHGAKQTDQNPIPARRPERRPYVRRSHSPVARADQSSQRGWSDRLRGRVEPSLPLRPSDNSRRSSRRSRRLACPPPSERRSASTRISSTFMAATLLAQYGG